MIPDEIIDAIGEIERSIANYSKHIYERDGVDKEEEEGRLKLKDSKCKLITTIAKYIKDCQKCQHNPQIALDLIDRIPRI